jgi:hypothetical protein
MNNPQGNADNLYVIPTKFRMLENLHIVFWLIKDLCWCIVYKPLGLLMIFPTLIIAGYIMWQNRKIESELYHNLAVFFWISANSIWMVSEFFAFDSLKLFENFTGKELALIPFVIGLGILCFYYVKFLVFGKTNIIEENVVQKQIIVEPISK